MKMEKGDNITVRWKHVKKAWRAQGAGDVQEVARMWPEMCEAWWLREKSEAGDCGIVEILE